MKEKSTVVLNLFAGPGSGKSTTMAGVFAELKWRGVDCEMAHEFAKTKVWEESYKTLDCQPYVFGKQLHNLFRLRGKVEAVITDSPIVLSLVYDKRKLQSFAQLVWDEFNSFQNINVFLKRQKKFNPNGRLQTEKQARQIDEKIKKILDHNCVSYSEMTGCRESVGKIADLVENFVIKHR